MDQSIRQLLRQRQRELDEAVGQRDRLNLSIIELEAHIKALNSVLYRNVLSTTIQGAQATAVGLTEAIRSAIRLTRRPMTAAEVKAALRQAGFDFERFSNASAVIHTTLKRLADSKELIFKPRSKTYEMAPARVTNMGAAHNR